MIIIKIKGGLGNQMFQYAYGRKLMLINKEEVIFDISFFTGEKSNKDTGRPFLLNKFNIDKSVNFINIKENIIKKTWAKIKSKMTGDYGFYQGEKYFKDIEDTIRQEFTLRDPLSREAHDICDLICKIQDTVSIHIRRGDYVSDTKTKSYHGAPDLSYYKKTISIIREKIDSPTFFIFSDDIDWTRNNLPLAGAVYVSNPNIKDYEELILMSRCKHNIIANSSFSWWGAWLNQNSDKIVMAPRQWTTKKTANELDILPRSWIQI